LPKDPSGCCKKGDTTVAGCPVAYSADGVALANTIKASDIPIDFKLTVMHQSSWDGTSTRNTATQWCDKQVTNFASVNDPEVTLLTGYAGMSGTTKCTYIVKTAADAGAPGFRVVYPGTNVFNFDLHYIEFEDSEMDYFASGANAVY